MRRNMPLSLLCVRFVKDADKMCIKKPDKIYIDKNKEDPKICLTALLYFHKRMQTQL